MKRLSVVTGMRWCLVMGLLLGLAGCVLTGCSVGMAMSGKEPPNLSGFGIGSPRGQVELHMGQPTASTTMPDGSRIDTYTYELGNAPSPGRAAGYAVLDVLTLGLWELAGTPIEAFQGETRQLLVTYGADDRVLAMNAPAATAR
jgi:hypothetical protein